MLAAGLTYGHQLSLIGLSLAVTYAIVYESGFDPQRRTPQQGPFRCPSAQTALAYVVSLVVAVGLLSLFNQIALDEPLTTIVTRSLVLGLPVAVGGAAGRLVL